MDYNVGSNIVELSKEFDNNVVRQKKKLEGFYDKWNFIIADFISTNFISIKHSNGRYNECFYKHTKNCIFLNKYTVLFEINLSKRSNMFISESQMAGTARLQLK